MAHPDELTTSRLLKRYNSLNRRRTAHDEDDREVMFGSLSRIYGSILPADRSTRILDAGCGEGSFLAFLKSEGYTNLHGFDLSEENVEICLNAGLGFVQRFNALELDEYPPSGEFDLIFALDLLEHLPKEMASRFIELARGRLKKGGKLVVQTPNMGCVYAQFHRYNDLSHEFGLTEKTARDLFMVGGFSDGEIDIAPVWHATTKMGYARELYARFVHRAIFMADDRDRPRIPTKNLLITATR
jgi:2-polyprenyl-3-methyl-5-hydroxy-6-metoxy-1,4-benzoquinol methylase